MFNNLQLLANAATQSGNDDEGILGFLEQDIARAIKDARKRKCKFCGKGRAASTCCGKYCKTSYHLACGLRNGCLFQFGGTFANFCPKHVPFADEELPEGEICLICHMALADTSPVKWIPSCCGEWNFHSSCMQKYAQNSGYYLKCIACDERSEEYRELLRSRGIFVPDADAVYEKEDDSPFGYGDLLKRHHRCDAAQCVCENGREFGKRSRTNPWFIKICATCGMVGIHNACDTQDNMKFICKVCTPIVNDGNNNVDQGNGTEQTGQPAKELNAVNDGNITVDQANGIEQANEPAHELNAVNDGCIDVNHTSGIEQANGPDNQLNEISIDITGNGIFENDDTLSNKFRIPGRSKSMDESSSAATAGRKRKLLEKGPSCYISIAAIEEVKAPISYKSFSNLSCENRRRRFASIDKIKPIRENSITEAGPSNCREHSPIKPAHSPLSPNFPMYLQRTLQDIYAQHPPPVEKRKIERNLREKVKPKIAENVSAAIIEISDSDPDTDELFSRIGTAPKHDNKKSQSAQIFPRKRARTDCRMSKDDYRKLRLTHLFLQKE